MANMDQTNAVFNARMQLNKMASFMDYCERNNIPVKKGSIPSMCLNLVVDALIKTGQAQPFTHTEATIFFAHRDIDVHKGGKGRFTLNQQMVVEDEIQRMLFRAQEKQSPAIDPNEEIRQQVELERIKAEAREMAKQSGMTPKEGEEPVERKPFIRLPKEESDRLIAAEKERLRKLHNKEGGDTE